MNPNPGVVCYASPNGPSPRQVRVILTTLLIVVAVTLVIAFIGWRWEGVLNVSLPLLILSAMALVPLHPS